MKKIVVFFLVAFLLPGCGNVVTVRPLPTNDNEFNDLCYDTYTAWPNVPATFYPDRIVEKCNKIVREYNERRIKEGKVPYQNDPNLLYWSYW